MPRNLHTRPSDAIANPILIHKRTKNKTCGLYYIYINICKCIKSYECAVLRALSAGRCIILPPAARKMAVIIRRLRQHFIFYNIHRPPTCRVIAATSFRSLSKTVYNFIRSVYIYMCIPTYSK